MIINGVIWHDIEDQVYQSDLWPWMVVYFNHESKEWVVGYAEITFDQYFSMPDVTFEDEHSYETKTRAFV